RRRDHRGCGRGRDVRARLAGYLAPMPERPARYRSPGDRLAAGAAAAVAPAVRASRVTMSAPRVTVAIPTFNRSAMLRQSIQSVLAQTYPSFRLVVRDNASDDDTPEVVRAFGDDRIHYVRSDVNVGAGGNITRLIELADTELVVILPDDDLLYPD